MIVRLLHLRVDSVFNVRDCVLSLHELVIPANIVP